MKTKILWIRILAVILVVSFSITAVARPNDTENVGRIPDKTEEQVQKEPTTPPVQAASGPGGADYSHDGVMDYVYGKGGAQYWIFEPMSPTLKSAPLILFNHGWSAMTPKIYGAWIEHIVRKGNIVVFPRYQAGLLTMPSQFTPNVINALKKAIKRLQGKGHTTPNLEKFAVVGHSMGGMLTATVAAVAQSNELPQPKAIMVIQPGISLMFKLPDLSQIPADTLMLCVVGDKDFVAGNNDAKKIFNESTQVPAGNKNYISFISDSHGKPVLSADHLSPLSFSDISTEPDAEAPDPNAAAMFAKGMNTIGSVNTLDYYGYWKLFDALTNCAFYGKDRKSALGNTPQQRFMGKWSDGTPVKELEVIDHP